MIAKITLYNGVVYKIGDKTQDTSDGLYAGRIVDELQIESKMSDKGATPLSLNITIRNDDNFIPNTVDLWAATIELTATNGNKWVGKINFFDFDADGNVYVTASEKTAPELELQLPDEVRQVYTVDNNFHPSSTSMTIPLVVGGTASAPITLSTILIDKQNGVYLICTGEIRQIIKVYNGSEELPASAYTAYTGTASQSEHAGFAYVKINEAYRKNTDGTYAEINVDIIGLKLGSYSAEECRNPARFLYYFLTTPSSGVNGWGCGISVSDIDSVSFNTAITLCDSLGYKMDGIMWLRQSAQSWIDQICQTMHASYTIGANGKRTLFIDYAGAASKRTFTENDCKVSRYGKNSYSGQVYNKGVLSYGYNPITGLFMQSAQFEDSASVSQIGEQKFVGESYLIGDASTALKVLEYTCKRSLISAEAIEFETDRLETLLKAGDLITLNFPSRNINAVYQIANISTSEYKSNISAVKFDPSVFNVSGSQTNIDWPKDRDITSALTPAQATNLDLQNHLATNPDGTSTLEILGSFTLPEGGWLAASVQYGIGTNPTEWIDLGLINNENFKISPVLAATTYSVRIMMITATGHSNYITGQISTLGDQEAPDAPVILASTYLKTIRVEITLDNPPSDLAGFEIWRSNIEGEHGSKIGFIAAPNGVATYVDTEAGEYLTDFYYSAKSVDHWGNASDYSSQVVANCAKIEAYDITSEFILVNNTLETARGVGSSVDGVKFSAKGVEGWRNGENVFNLSAVKIPTIGGWKIGKDVLYGDKIQMYSTGVIKTSDYVSEENGWSIDGYGNAEFNNLRARGSIKTLVFEKDEISVIGGNELVRPASVSTISQSNAGYFTEGFLVDEDNYSVAEVTDRYNQVLDSLNSLMDSEETLEPLSETMTFAEYVNLESGYNASAANLMDYHLMSGNGVVVFVQDGDVFNVGDIIRVKNGLEFDVWGTVTEKNVDSYYGDYIIFSINYGTYTEIEAGQCIINYGVAGTGGILLDGNSPFIDLYTHNGQPWNGVNTWCRIGNLKGINGILVDRHGFFAGNSDTAVADRNYMQYDDHSGQLEIQGTIKATSGNIGKFELTNGVLTYTKDNLDFDDGSIVIQNPNVVIEGQNAGSFKTMMTLGGIKSEINFSNALNRGSYVIETGLNLDSSSSHYGNVETQYSHVAQDELSQSNVIISSGYIDINTYNRTTASATWNRTANFGIGVSGISQTYKDNAFDRTMQTSAFGFSINDSATNNRCSLTPTELFIGSNSAGINLYIDNTSEVISGNLTKCHTIGLNGSGTGVIRTIGIALDSSYGSAVPALNIGVPSASHLAFATSGQISVGGVRGNLEITGYVKSDTLTTGTVSSSNGVLTGSAEESKTNIRNVSVLNKLKSLRVMQWNYKTDLDTLHIGPMAKDFNTLFKVNKESGEGINYTDSIGVALKAIQELSSIVDELKQEIIQLRKGER